MRPTSHAARARTLWALLLVAGLCLAVFGRTLGFDFVDYDDAGYIERNPSVLAGWTADGLGWALRTPHMGLWAPLTWLSYMTEVELAGPSASVFHATNLALHTLNSALLLLFLRSLTGALAPSLLAALLFAVHPLHVEPVAWIASRKDLLSTLFGWLSLMAYLHHARAVRGAGGAPGGAKLAYALAWLCLALGLLAKPMLVSWPLLFLAIDGWLDAREGAPAHDAPGLASRLWTKLPFLLLAAAAGAVAHWAQSSAGAVSDAVPLGARGANALVSYFAYVEKSLWPSGLNVLYPHPFIEGAGGTPPSTARLLLAACFALLFAGLALARGAPRWLRFGWLWYSLTLLPVLGLVPLGRQAMADRFSYVPLVGVFLILACGLGAFVERRPPLARPTLTLAVAWVLLLAGLASRQCGHWRDAVALYGRALEVNPRNATMHFNLGYVRTRRGEPELAVASFQRAVELQPSYGKAHHNLAVLLHARGELEQAVRHYRAAVDLLSGEQRESARRSLTRASAEWATQQR